MNFSRRDFLGFSAMAGAAFALPGCCSRCCCGGKGARSSVQLYSVRGLMKDKAAFADTLKLMADIGYPAVEFAGYGGYSAAELKDLLDRNGLVASGTHIGFNQVSPENIHKTMDFVRGFGCDQAVVPWMNAPKDCTDVKGFWKDFGEKMSVAADTAKKEGFHIGYHNHQHEFRTVVDGKQAWDWMMENASKDLEIQFDVGHIVSAGEDPAKWFAKYPGRSRTIHAKEVYYKGAPGILGQPGNQKGVDWDAVFAATDRDITKWYVVECESDPTTDRIVRASYEFLKAKGRA